eukprot:scaffold3038_cov250-Pinguiococcus_pyrenoidosus.AAC.10
MAKLQHASDARGHELEGGGGAGLSIRQDQLNIVRDMSERIGALKAAAATHYQQQEIPMYHVLPRRTRSSTLGLGGGCAGNAQLTS